MRVVKRFKFDAAHKLVYYVGDCSRLHGHTWFLDVEVEGPVDSGGFVMDFVELKKLVNEKVIARIDHNYLNDLFGEGFVPTCENLLTKFWGTLDSFGPPWKLSRLRLYEGGSLDSYAELLRKDVHGE